MLSLPERADSTEEEQQQQPPAEEEPGAAPAPGAEAEVPAPGAAEAEDASRGAPALLTCSSGELSRSCRICLMGDNGEPLVSPCKCRGSMGMVHLSCLERWLSQHSRNYCELCLFEFPVTRIPRYSVARSLRLWFCHPRVRQSLMEDLLVLAALTFVVAGIVAVCLLGLQYFAAEGLKLGISRAYTVAVISSFMALVLLGYFVIVCLLVRDLVVPWHVWWRRCAVVRIILD